MTQDTSTTSAKELFDLDPDRVRCPYPVFAEMRSAASGDVVRRHRLVRRHELRPDRRGAQAAGQVLESVRHRAGDAAAAGQGDDRAHRRGPGDGRARRTTDDVRLGARAPERGPAGPPPTAGAGEPGVQPAGHPTARARDRRARPPAGRRLRRPRARRAGVRVRRAAPDDRHRQGAGRGPRPDGRLHPLVAHRRGRASATRRSARRSWPRSSGPRPSWPTTSSASCSSARSSPRTTSSRRSSSRPSTASGSRRCEVVDMSRAVPARRQRHHGEADRHLDAPACAGPRPGRRAAQ